MAESPVSKKTYEKPEVQSEFIYETMALGCAQCLNRDPGTEFGFGDGNCPQSLSTY